MYRTQYELFSYLLNSRTPNGKKILTKSSLDLLRKLRLKQAAAIGNITPSQEEELKKIMQNDSDGEDSEEDKYVLVNSLYPNNGKQLDCWPRSLSNKQVENIEDLPIQEARLHQNFNREPPISQSIEQIVPRESVFYT